MRNLINDLFYFIWRLLSPFNFSLYLFSRKSKISRKKSLNGYLPQLDKISDIIKAELLTNQSFITQVENAKTSTDDFGFSFDCLPYITPNTKKILLETALYDSFIISNVKNFLGIKPTLNTISIYANVPRANDQEVGSKMWHRDGLTFLTADFMFSITEISDRNGPFFYIDPFDFGSNKVIKPKVNLGWKMGGRYSTEDLVEAGLDIQNIKKFVGPQGNFILLNTGEAYHRGGYCESEIRILGRFVYSSFGYSKGNLNKYGLTKNSNQEILQKLSNTCYSIHEKVYRNIISKL